MQLRRRISALINRARPMMAASSLSSRVGLRRTWSGVPTMPTSCNRATISSSSRCRASKSSRVAQAEQVRATRIEWLAVAACLHCNAVNRLPAIPSRRLASWSSDDSSGATANDGPPRAPPSSSCSSDPSAVIQCSEVAPATSGVSIGIGLPALGGLVMNDRFFKAGFAQTGGRGVQYRAIPPRTGRVNGSIERLGHRRGRVKKLCEKSTHNEALLYSGAK